MSSDNTPLARVLSASQKLWNISNGLCEEDFNPSSAGLPDLTEEEWDLLTPFANPYLRTPDTAYSAIELNANFRLFEQMIREARILLEQMDDHSSRFRFRTDGWVKRFIGEVGEDEEEDRY